VNIDFSKLNRFEWDSGNLEHIKRHLVTDKESEDVFSNKPLIITKDEIHSKFEKRYRVYGRTFGNRYLNIIFTIRKNNLRVISARDQNKKERNEYIKNGGEIND